MTIRRFRRKIRCLIRYGPHGCPHIERHSRRPRRRVDRPSTPPPLPSLPSEGRHVKG